ncbi:MAG TPA: hypothetical protein PLK30_11925, partial [Blastocatellia bacterium]|nr:hypothetical protein [Blastocatellia bacterium]
MTMNRRTFLERLPAVALPNLVRFTSKPRTTVSIRGEQFFINGRPTYAGRRYKGMKIEGLLMNSRM